jgi:hypothetical protein
MGGYPKDRLDPVQDVPGFADVDEETLVRQVAMMRPIMYSDVMRLLPLPLFPFHGGDPVPPSMEAERAAEQEVLEERFEELRERCDDALRPKPVH